MVRAAAAKGLDYHHADSQDPIWLLHEYLVTGMIERDIDVECIRARPTQSGKQKGTLLPSNRVAELLRPYRGDDASVVAQSMRRAWIKEYGDPNDPKVKDTLQKDRQRIARMDVLADQTRRQQQEQELEIQRKLDEINKKRARIYHGAK